MWIVVGAPYVLLLALLAVVLWTWWQAKLEVEEAKHLRHFIDRAKRLAEQKDGFIQLAVAFMRAPMAQLSDSLAKRGFEDAVQAFLSKVSGDRLAAMQAPAPLPPIKPWWKTARFWVPLVLVAQLAALAQVWLLVAGNQLDPVNVITQASFFVGLAIALYIGVGTQQASERERAVAKQLSDREINIDQARNAHIAEAAQTLAQKLEGLKQSSPPEVTERLGKVMQRFSATATVIPQDKPFEKFRFSVLLSQAQGMVSQTAFDKNISIVPGGLEDITMASQQPAWIVQVLGAALENAIAASKEGSQIEVSASVRGTVGTVMVVDRGEGLPAEKIAQLFQPFTQIKGQTEGGIGMNIHFCRLIAAGLGGELHVTSPSGQGTTVSLSFPLQ